MQVFNPATDKREEYIGGIRYDIFTSYNISKTSNIVEVAPGCLPKIGYGLQKLMFKGNLYVVEPDATSLETIVSIYKDMLPGTTVIPIMTELKDASMYLPTNIDVLCSNHPLDDMIISYANYAITTQEYYRGCYGHPDLSKTVWNDIANKKNELDHINSLIIKDWLFVIEKCNPKYVFISQYKSYYYQKNNILMPDMLSQSILHKLKSILGSNNNDAHMLLSKHQNPDEWLIVNR